MPENTNKPKSLRHIYTIIIHSIKSSPIWRLSRFNLMNEAVDHFMIDY